MATPARPAGTGSSRRARAGWLSGSAATIIPAGDGQSVSAGGIPARVKIHPAPVDGALLMIEQDLQPAQLVPAHRHVGTAQWSLVTRGALTFLVGDRTYQVGEGDVIIRPPGIVHAVWNPGPGTATQVEGNMPGTGMLRYYHRYAELTAAGDATQDEIAALAAAYGVLFDPDLTRQLEQAHQVAVLPAGGALL